jgi:hypothetical protein
VKIVPIYFSLHQKLRRHSEEGFTGTLQETLKQVLQYLLLIRLKSDEPVCYDIPASQAPCLYMFMSLSSKLHAHYALIVALALASHESALFQAFASSCNRTARDTQRFSQFANTECAFPTQKPQ